MFAIVCSDNGTSLWACECSFVMFCPCSTCNVIHFGVAEVMYCHCNIAYIIYPHRIHVWYIYLHLADLYGKCGKYTIHGSYGIYIYIYTLLGTITYSLPCKGLWSRWYLSCRQGIDFANRVDLADVFSGHIGGHRKMRSCSFGFCCGRWRFDLSWLSSDSVLNVFQGVVRLDDWASTLISHFSFGTIPNIECAVRRKKGALNLKKHGVYIYIHIVK